MRSLKGVKLEGRDQIQNRRREIWETYHTALAAWAGENGARTPVIPEYCEQSYHMYYLLMPDLATRTEFISYLKERDITAVFHYLPLHRSPMGEACSSREHACPVTEDISDRLVRLPFYFSLSEEEQARVIDTILSFRCRPEVIEAATTEEGMS
jgi:dTDP-4-amino-4,6-dideoxygalactose transaminase